VVGPGCTLPTEPMSAARREVAETARPILEMDPDAVWAECYNRLVARGPASLKYLAEHPTLQRTCAPDDLRVMLHVSLVRLLVHPAMRPKLSANCLETTLDLLYFDLKVAGRSIGAPRWAERELPTVWHELYPADLDHDLADRIDTEADRRALCQWWQEHRDHPGLVWDGRRLTPRAETVWDLLSRRYADRWSYQPVARATRCAAPPPEAMLFWSATYDYNLTRAACVWLGSSSRPEIRDRLVTLGAHASPVVAHNALFALHYAPDSRIRALFERYKNGPGQGPPEAPPQDEPSVLLISSRDRW